MISEIEAILNVWHIINKLENTYVIHLLYVYAYVHTYVHTYVICVTIRMTLKRNMMYVILSIRCWLLIVCYLSRLITNTTSNLTVPAWNVRGIHPAIRYLIWLMQDADATCISALWLCENNLYVLNQISDELAVVSAVNKLSIWMTLFWKSNLLGATPISYLVHDKLCSVRYQTTNRLILNIITFYLPVLIQIPT